MEEIESRQDIFDYWKIARETYLVPKTKQTADSKAIDQGSHASNEKKILEELDADRQKIDYSFGHKLYLLLIHSGDGFPIHFQRVVLTRYLVMLLFTEPQFPSPSYSSFHP